MARTVQSIRGGVVKNGARRMGAQPAVCHVFVGRGAQQNARLRIRWVGEDFRSTDRNLIRLRYCAWREASGVFRAKVDGQPCHGRDCSPRHNNLAETAAWYFGFIASFDKGLLSNGFVLLMLRSFGFVSVACTHRQARILRKRRIAR
jgi:hypothetical protein